MAMLDEAQREPTPETRVSRYLAINMERFARIERGEETAFAVLSDLRAMEEPYRDPLLAGWREVFRKTRASSGRSEEHTSELQSLMRISYAVFCLKKKTIQHP